MRVAVTGHMNITEKTAVLVGEEIARHLAEVPDLVGVSCIAREAYEAANEALLASAQLLVAVWDGEGGEAGGTGSVVKPARERGVAVDVVWPEGAARA